MFLNRVEAGEKISNRLLSVPRKKAVVCGVARGGVVVSSVIGRRLSLPIFVVNVKKIGAPNNNELALGAVSSGGAVWIDHDLVKRLGISKPDFLKMISLKRQELKTREKLFLSPSPRSLLGKTVYLVDDGVATGATIKAALLFLKKKKPDKICLVTPVIASDTYTELMPLFDRIISLEVPKSFGSVGQFYKDFSQVTDEDVLRLLKKRKE